MSWVVGFLGHFSLAAIVWFVPLALAFSLLDDNPNTDALLVFAAIPWSVICLIAAFTLGVWQPWS